MLVYAEINKYIGLYHTYTHICTRMLHIYTSCVYNPHFIRKQYAIVLQAVGQCHQMDREATFNS